MTGERKLQGDASPTQFSSDELADLNTRFSQILKQYFMRRGARADIAEDLAQDVFMRLAGRAATTRIDNVDAYLMQTASSVWKDHARKLRSHEDAAHVEYDDPLHGYEERSPERVYEGREGVRRVLDALDALSDRSRQVFVLRRFEGMSQKEVARRLGVSVSLVEKEMMKAIAHISDWFGDGK